MKLWLGQSEINEKPFSSRITQKINFLSSQQDPNPWPSRILFGYHWAMEDSLRTLLHLFHLIQVTSSLIIYLHLSFRHNYWSLLYSKACVAHKNLVHKLARHESSIGQWLERSSGILEGHGFNCCWGKFSENFFFWIIWLDNCSSFFSVTLSPLLCWMCCCHLNAITLQGVWLPPYYYYFAGCVATNLLPLLCRVSCCHPITITLQGVLLPPYHHYFAGCVAATLLP